MAQDDTMLRATRALAGGDEAEARRILGDDGLGRFNTQRELENGIAQAQSVQRAGGARVQVATTMALAGINTGFEGREVRDANGEIVRDAQGNAVMHATSKAMMTEIAEASGGDAVLANQMMGRMKGMAMQAGRLEEGGASYAAMNGELRHALGARAAGGTYDQIAGAVDNHALNLNALENNDSVSVVRSQANSVSSLMGSAQQRLNELDTEQRSGAFAALDAEDQLAHQQERGRLTSIVENTHATGSMYAAPSRVTQTQQGLDNTARARAQVRAESDTLRIPHPTIPGATVEVTEKVDVHTGGVVPAAHPDAIVPPQVRGYREQRQQRGYNPDDPRNAGP
ncbi:MAG: hypothetical protein WDN66_00580 [Candidatus Saccharibacteria bacterium]